jgi:hypothetical protein
VPVGLLDRRRSVPAPAGCAVAAAADALADPAVCRRSFAPGTLPDVWPAVR